MSLGSLNTQNESLQGFWEGINLDGRAVVFAMQRPFPSLFFFLLALPLVSGPAPAQDDDTLDLSVSDQQQDLFSARKAIVDNRYADAIRIAERMLRRNDCDLDALKIKGSAYYLSGQSERARNVWLYALRLHPSDRDLKTYLPMVQPPPAVAR